MKPSNIEEAVIRPVTIFDFDGVLTNPEFIETVFRRLDRSESVFVCVTGRCFDEWHPVHEYLKEHDLLMPVYFNTMNLKDRGRGTEHSRIFSAWHKSNIITSFFQNNVGIVAIYEDDNLQIECIKKECAWSDEGFPDLDTLIIHVQSEVEK